MYQLNALARQFAWRGAALSDTGYLVCPKCMDVPSQQYRTIILPGDPYPRVNPRPPTYDLNIGTPGGFDLDFDGSFDG
jgi:hypothetical protein